MLLKILTILLQPFFVHMVTGTKHGILVIAQENDQLHKLTGHLPPAIVIL